MNILMRLRGLDPVDALDIPILGLVVTGLLLVTLLMVTS